MEDPKISTEHMYTLISSPVQGTLDEISKKPELPILAFTANLYCKIKYITHSIPNSEYAVFLKVRKIDEHVPHFLAYDFFMPKQTASGGGVKLDGDDCSKQFEKHGLPHKCLAHLHSHAGMGCFWSSIDDTQQLTRDDLGFMDDYRLYCVVNTKDEIKCSLVVYRPVMVRVDCAVAVSYAETEYIEAISKKDKAELDKLVSTQVQKSAVATGEFAQTYNEKAWGWYDTPKTYNNWGKLPVESNTPINNNYLTSYYEDMPLLNSIMTYLKGYSARCEPMMDNCRYFAAAAGIRNIMNARLLFSWLLDHLSSSLYSQEDADYIGDYVGQVLSFSLTGDMSISEEYSFDTESIMAFIKSNDMEGLLAEICEILESQYEILNEEAINA